MIHFDIDTHQTFPVDKNQFDQFCFVSFKVISSYSQYQTIPRRIKISKRLAQCMHPALPSGVHLKALETYDVIFNNTGVERLASELFIYRYAVHIALYISLLHVIRHYE